MGAEACGCKRPAVVADPNMQNPINQNWADAIKKNKISGVMGLHCQDPDIIDSAIDEDNICAIHAVVQYKYYNILDYLLKHRININIQETNYGNTALHIAVINKDLIAIEKLFGYDDIDDKVFNYNGKEAAHLSDTKQFKREYLKAMQRGIKNRIKRRNLYNQQHNLSSSPRSLISPTTASTASISQSPRIVSDDDVYCDYLTKCDNLININDDLLDLNGKYRGHNQFITRFGEKTGVDIDEMAMCVQKINHSNTRLWKKLQKKSIIKKEKGICKLLYGICVLTIQQKKGNNNNNDEKKSCERPPTQPIKQLNKKMCAILRRNAGKINLDENTFKKHFHNYLHEINQQIIMA